MTVKANQLWIVREAGELSDAISELVNLWNAYPRNIIGEQLTSAADSVGANIAEGYGRSHTQDAQRFYSIARGSLEESIHWLQRARNRELLDRSNCSQLIARYQILSRSLNKFMQSQTNRPPTEILPRPSLH